MRVLPPPTFIPNYTKIPDTIKSEKYFYPKPETELQNPLTSTDNGLEDSFLTMGELTGIKDLQALNLSGSYPRKPHKAPLNCTKPLQPITDVHNNCSKKQAI